FFQSSGPSYTPPPRPEPPPQPPPRRPPPRAQPPPRREPPPRRPPPRDDGPRQAPPEPPPRTARERSSAKWVIATILSAGALAGLVALTTGGKSGADRTASETARQPGVTWAVNSKVA